MTYEYYPFLILRTPSFTLLNLLNHDAPDFLSDPLFKEALFLASPDLADILFNKKAPIEGSLAITVSKYFNRMCFRCTPFGLFAGCSLMKWGDNTHIKIDFNEAIRRTRPDKTYLAGLLYILNTTKSIFCNLDIKLNNTLYAIGNEYRIIEKGEDESEFNISSINADDVFAYFIQIIGDSWIGVLQIIKKSEEKGFSSKETLRYLKHLLDNQVITTNLDAALNNNELLNHWIDSLTKISKGARGREINKWKHLLQQFKLQLELTDQKINQDFNAYYPVYDVINELGIKQPLNRIFQVDFSFKKNGNTLGFKTQRTLNKAIDVLKKISVLNKQNVTFNSFKQRFLKKYEQQEVPLLLALDPETGIDYLEGSSSFDGFLSREIAIEPIGNDRGDFGPNFNLKLILQKYEDAIAAGEKVIELTEQDIDRMENYEPVLPVTTSVFFRLISEDSLQIESVGGSSGVNLFTRFTDFNADFNNMVTEVTTIEQEINENIILAEVIHEPEPRAGNVLSYISSRQYDIPYFSNSYKSDQEQLYLNDLLLSVNNGKFLLRSKRLNKQVKPMISSAYNYLKGSPIFRFLGELQNEGTDNLQFNFDDILPDKNFYPRLSYKGIIFSLAKWKLSFTMLQDSANEITHAAIRQFLKKREVPQLFIITEGDNELLIDIERDSMLSVFEDMFRKRKTLFVKEFLIDKDKYQVVNDKQQPLNNQMVAILLNKNNEQQKVSKTLWNQERQVQRKFSLGSEWLYYKIYCGIISADKLLSGYILLLVDDLKKRKLIKQFFFIRYYDPEPHIRLRFKLANLSDLQDVINIMKISLAAPEQSGQIWKIQTDTYVRELERYGIAIEETEQLFYIDSLAILRLLSSSILKESTELRLAAGIRMTHDLLTCMLSSESEKLTFIKVAKSSLKQDINPDPMVDKTINKSYRENIETYLFFMEPNSKAAERIFISRKKAMTKNTNTILSGFTGTADHNEVYHLLGSYIHMSINRLFVSNQKVYEYIVYDYLFKYYKMKANKK